MVEEHSLVSLLNTYMDQEDPPIIELLNIKHEPVGALYLKGLRYKNLTIAETPTSEKYYLYVDGVGIYFSFFTKKQL